MTSYPQAEAIGRTMELPLVVDKATQELYGYTTWVLDYAKVRNHLSKHGIRVGTEADAAALAEIESRYDAMFSH